jgi:peptidoglycan hydrolase-like protein with peptidoglycan-binding domain
MIRSITIVLVFGSLVLAGCGDDSTTKTVTQTAPATAANPAVVQLQLGMTSLGYYEGPIDGIYGEETAAGVKDMQEDLGVEADGIFGPETYTALKKETKSAALATNIVVSIQTTLKYYGYYEGPIDGVYGEETTAAVKELQTDLGVTADGRVGTETVTAFNEAVESGKIEPASQTS